MRDFLPLFAVGLGVPLTFALLDRAARRAGPLEASPTSGRIGPGRAAIVLLSVCTVAFCIGGFVGTVYGLVSGDYLLAGTSVFILSLGLGSFWGTLMMMSPGAHIVWDADGVRGPAKAWSLSRVPEQAIIPWTAIVHLEEQDNGTCYVQTANGTRVYWSRYYAGYDVFEGALLARRPELRA
ncbi:hypothetical protein [Parvularcula dongshanensis]|uniref:Uncharacterized protein n=1 Tax=Parvularcula dongshanensis TaxID=1173995 RepID=A0A840I7M7_9PROT|nr:hypothetical protein [Parvularcula dongshanensis]MBB4660335.1 hypothetical protein [Parvularcula dongshanensis]